MDEEESRQGRRHQTQRQGGSRLKQRSKVWEDFTRYTGADGKEKAKCDRCGKVYAYHGTKNLKEHLDEGCGGPSESDDAGAEQQSQEPGLAAEEQAHHGPGLDEEEASRDLARMIALGGHDPSVVEDEYFRSFVRRLNPGFKLPSRQAIEKMVRGEDSWKASSDRQRLMESVRKETCPPAGGTTAIAAAATSLAQVAASPLLPASQAPVPRAPSPGSDVAQELPPQLLGQLGAALDNKIQDTDPSLPDERSLAERVRREQISQRMKLLQHLVPGCSKVVGKVVMLDEIINYVQSLQRQVDFLSIKLATESPAGLQLPAS